MAKRKVTLIDMHLPEQAPGKSWGVPMLGDLFRMEGEEQGAAYFKITSIKDSEEGTLYTIEELSEQNAQSRISKLHYQCFTAEYTDASLGHIRFLGLKEN